MMAFVPDQFICDFRFMHYFFLNLKFGKLVSATALPSIGAKDIGNLVFKFPKKAEQQAIAQILSDMDNELEALKAKLSKTKAIKEGMMSELLTGKTRLKGAKDE
jgi:type I restriction enzyme S subunit